MTLIPPRVHATSFTISLTVVDAGEVAEEEGDEEVEDDEVGDEDDGQEVRDARPTRHVPSHCIEQVGSNWSRFTQPITNHCDNHLPAVPHRLDPLAAKHPEHYHEAETM